MAKQPLDLSTGKGGRKGGFGFQLQVNFWLKVWAGNLLKKLRKKVHILAGLKFYFFRLINSDVIIQFYLFFFERENVSTRVQRDQKKSMLVDENIKVSKFYMVFLKKKYSYPKRVKGRYWRLVIPAIKGYGIRPSRPHPGLKALKHQVLDCLLAREKSRGLEHWCIAWQTHPGSGLPHLDILLGYKVAVQNTLKRYDVLLKHGNLTRYRTLNVGIIQYGRKEDPEPLSNILSSQNLIFQAQINEGRLYNILERAMRQDPWNFRMQDWLEERNLYRFASRKGYISCKRILTEQQAAICRQSFKNRAGVAQITREVITRLLSAGELKSFKSWSGYQRVVDFINQIPIWGYHRPHKTPNLLLVGRPNTGKTSLLNALAKRTSVYPLGTRGGWFPGYCDGVFKLLRWDEFSLKVYPYPQLLRMLEGISITLPIKGGHVPRRDNQLIIMTSNLTLQQHICNKFKAVAGRQYARLNLAPRVTEVIIPQDVNLFLLIKLLG